MTNASALSNSVRIIYYNSPKRVTTFVVILRSSGGDRFRPSDAQWRQFHGVCSNWRSLCEPRHSGGRSSAAERPVPHKWVWTTFIPALWRHWLKCGRAVDVLRNHVVDCVTCSAAISEHTQRVKTLQDTFLGVTRHSYGVFVNDAQVLTSDVMASNGVVHVIDKVLITDEG